ncbi:MAG: VOC family protein [Opitutaceae bacterium]
MRTSTDDLTGAVWPEATESRMTARSEMRAWVPGIVSARFFETWDFYTTLLGFRTLAESNTYVHLQHPIGTQLAVLREETDGAPEELVCATRGRGFWLMLEVDDALAEHQRLGEAGVVPVGALRDTPWGDRQFVLRDPNGVLVYLVQRKVDREAATEVGACLASVGIPVAG